MSQLKQPHNSIDNFKSLTGKISEPAVAGAEEIGEKVKSIREKRGLSIEKLSEMTGFGAKFLEGIENNTIHPQLGETIKLSKVLDSAFAGLVSESGNRMYSITRVGDTKTTHSATNKKGNEVYTYVNIAPEVKNRHMESLIVYLKENPTTDMSIHSGEEFIFVLDGVVELKIDNKAIELSPGDSAYYLSTMPHLIAAKKEKATILAVMYSNDD